MTDTAAFPLWPAVNGESSSSTLPSSAGRKQPVRRGALAATGRGAQLAIRKAIKSTQRDEDIQMGGERKKRISTTSRNQKTADLPSSKPYSRGLAKRGRGIDRASSRTAASPSTRGAIDSLKDFLSRRYNASQKLLDLENMAIDPIFKGPNALVVPGSKNSKSSSVAPALWKLASEHHPDIVSLSLAGNSLISLTDLAIPALIQFLPNIENLSLKNNLLAEVKVLNPLSPDANGVRTGLACIRELVLEGNPLVDQARLQGKQEDLYKKAIALRFPTLTTVDGFALDPVQAPKPVPKGKTVALGSGLVSNATFPLGTMAGFCDETKDVIMMFLAKFISLYDTNRQACLSSYAPDSTFSLSVNSAIPHRAKASRSIQDLPKQHTLDWKPYFELNRNMIKSSRASDEQLETQVASSLAVGPAAIGQLLTKLPQTSHPLDDPASFIVDAWSCPALSQGLSSIFVSMHGQFAEGSGKGLRSFDRTFLLAPPQPGSSAALEGWPCTILSDQLLVRGFSDPKAWSTNSLPTAQPVLQSPVAHYILSAEQQSLVAQLQAETKLNLHFSLQCLAESSWDYAQALSNFRQVASTIPPEAFVAA